MLLGARPDRPARRPRAGTTGRYRTGALREGDTGPAVVGLRQRLCRIPVRVQRRHIVHLEPTEPTPERWTSQEDHDREREPARFECFWIPLEAAHVLQSGQGALLGRLYD